uniref:Exocyst complex component 5 n=2 Tax=Timema TaxID=61471 RepID=A0A7R9PQ95_TIMGE|nr:unnamed protein product [Timema genevievae]
MGSRYIITQTVQLSRLSELESALQPLQQLKPFDPEEFVERLAWRTIEGSRDGSGQFDPVLLHETFVQAIKDLHVLQERQQKKCERLEMMCREEENNHWQKISQLQDQNKRMNSHLRQELHMMMVQKFPINNQSTNLDVSLSSMSLFQELDERINYVAAKVIHLGDQLESVNTPRARAVEAQKLMNYFAEFLSPGPLLAQIFTDKGQIDEAADIIQKLHLIAQELPSGKFEKAKKKIASKYDEIERSLIEEFVKAHRSADIGRMKEIATILSHFKGYSQCVDAFIEQSQMGAFAGKDVFRDVIPLCEKNFAVMKEVFNNPDQVMAKYVLNIYHLKLQRIPVCAGHNYHLSTSAVHGGYHTVSVYGECLTVIRCWEEDFSTVAECCGKLENEHLLPSRGLIHIITEKGPYPASLRKLGLVDSGECLCGQEGAPEHVILECVRTQEDRRTYQTGIQGRLVGHILSPPVLWKLLNAIASELSEGARNDHLAIRNEARQRGLRQDRYEQRNMITLMMTHRAMLRPTPVKTH